MGSTKANNAFLRANHGVTPESVADILWGMPSVRRQMVKVAKAVGYNPLTSAKIVEFITSEELKAYVLRSYQVWAFRSLRKQAGNSGRIWIGTLIMRDWLALMAPPQEVMACVAKKIVEATGRRALDRAETGVKSVMTNQATAGPSVR